MLSKVTANLVLANLQWLTAPVAQGIERRPPEAGAQVRILPGAPQMDLEDVVVAIWPRTISKRKAWIVWAITRIIIVGIWTPFIASGVNDVRYYFETSKLLYTSGIEFTLLEYPTPVVWLFQIPYLLGFGSYVGYATIFITFTLLLDFLFSYKLTSFENGTAALMLWTALLASMGPTTYLRFDLITAVLSGWALLLAATKNQRFAGFLVAIGAALKLWPALSWPALLFSKNNKKISIWFWSIGITIAIIAGIFGGWQRLFTPIIWQRNRGLQIESILATWPMLQRIADPQIWRIYLTTWQAWEIFGPGVDFWLKATSALTAIGMLFIVYCYFSWLRKPVRTGSEAAILTALVVMIMIVTNKTFSPQYLLWLFGPLAAGTAITNQKDQLFKPINQLALAVLLLSLMTLILYPIGYYHLVHFTAATPIVTAVLVLRNTTAVAIMLLMSKLALKISKPDRE